MSFTKTNNPSPLLKRIHDWVRLSESTSTPVLIHYVPLTRLFVLWHKHRGLTCYIFTLQLLSFCDNGPKQSHFLCVETRNWTLETGTVDLDQCVLFWSLWVMSVFSRGPCADGIITWMLQVSIYLGSGGPVLSCWWPSGTGMWSVVVRFPWRCRCSYRSQTDEAVSESGWRLQSAERWTSSRSDLWNSGSGSLDCPRSTDAGGLWMDWDHCGSRALRWLC